MAAVLHPRLVAAAHYFERYLLPLVFLWFATRAFGELAGIFQERPYSDVDRHLWLLRLVRSFNLFLLQLLIAFLLLRSRKPIEPPRQWREVLVPLAVSFFFVLYTTVDFFPAPLRRLLAPPTVLAPFAILSALSALAGSLLAVWGVVSLGRSFGIFVAVRTVVTTGPYGYVRHPIYSGYLLVWVGLILANPSAGMMGLVAIHTTLMVYRARLEERRLALASPEYRAYVERTGFLFPRVDSGSLHEPS